MARRWIHDWYEAYRDTCSTSNIKDPPEKPELLQTTQSVRFQLAMHLASGCHIL